MLFKIIELEITNTAKITNITEQAKNKNLKFFFIILFQMSVT